MNEILSFEGFYRHIKILEARFWENTIEILNRLKILCYCSFRAITHTRGFILKEKTSIEYELDAIPDEGSRLLWRDG